MLVVERRRRSILLADCVDASGITQRLGILRPHLRAERICRRAPTAKRVIDHGVRAAEDPRLVRRLADERITLNICLSSNLSLVYHALREHPIGLLHEAGAPVTINTDDPLMLGVTLTGEMAMAAEHLGWDVSDLAATTHRAVDAAFCSAAEKDRLHTAVIAFAGSLT